MIGNTSTNVTFRPLECSEEGCLTYLVSVTRAVSTGMKCTIDDKSATKARNYHVMVERYVIGFCVWSNLEE